MRLGTVLSNIVETEGTTREQWKVEFENRVLGHKDENLLLACFKEACNGRRYIVLDKGTLPPASLEEEGFHFEKEPLTGRHLYYFE